MFRKTEELMAVGEYTLALAEAEQVVGALPPDNGAARGALAGYQIDVGSRLERDDIVRTGIAGLEALRGVLEDGHVDYCLGNGHLALGGREEGNAVGAQPSLQKAVEHFERALKNRRDDQVRTNLATALQYQGRYIEALDEYDLVVQANPKHEIALAQRGRCLWLIAALLRHHGGLLVGALNDHLRAIECVVGRPVPDSYTDAVRRLLKRGVRPQIPEKVIGTPTQEWIIGAQLGLDPCPICKTASPGAFDVFPLSGPLRMKRPGGSYEAILDTFNALCRTYGTARWCLMRGLGVVELDPGEDIVLAPTMLHAHTSVRAGLTVTAATQFFMVFQQASCLLNLIFELGHNLRQVDFWRVWAPPDPPKGQRRSAPLAPGELHPKLALSRNFALNALYRLACSLDVRQGRHGSLRDLRNKLAHRIVVVGTEDRESSEYVMMRPETIEMGTLGLARLAKAAIWYLAWTVQGEEDAVLERTPGAVILDGPGVLRV
ncbi:MAG: hypothetical protein IT348_14035 [Candidatus Eisenbacteria bacterium]|nr:hypothetical protein [Candidatus Eisenbacteria bacterium]